MTKPSLLFSFSGVLLFSVLSLSQTQKPPAQTDATVHVPIGGIIMWWGLAVDIPEGFEACDGTVVTTRNAVLRGAKPNLETKFPRGAAQYRNFVPQAFTGGGQDEIKISDLKIADHVLTEDQLPSHSHKLNLEHSVTGRPSGQPKNSLQHAHSVGEYESQTFKDHDHIVPIIEDTLEDVTIADPGVDLTYLRKATTTESGIPTETQGLKTQVPMPSGSVIDNHTQDTLSTGHKGPILLSHKAVGGSITLDNRPAFVDVVFLIRVK